MAHEITVRSNGRVEAAFAMEPAWHGLGTVLDHAMTSAEAIEAAGLDWEVVKRPVAVLYPVEIETPEGPVTVDRFHPVPNQYATCRADNGEFLGTVTEAYRIVQNREGFAFLDALVQDRQMVYESAFSLAGGRKVCLLGRLPEFDSIVAGDDVLRYVLLSLHHDGSGAIRFGPTAVRVVCANTRALAIAKGTVKELAIRHTGNIQEKLQEARRIIGLARRAFDAEAAVAKRLAQYRMTDAEWRAYLDLLCPALDERDPDYTEARAKAIAKTRQAIGDVYRNERQNLPGMAGTAWAAYCAVAEYTDHLPRRGATPRAKAEARFNVALYGAGRDHKDRAWRAACNFAGVSLAG